MVTEERDFNFRISLEAHFPEEYEGTEDEYAWLREWEAHMKPQLIKQLFDSLRQFPSWKAHVRNRGKSPQEEIEIALVRDFSKPHLPY
jgi:hypothetical protein